MTTPKALDSSEIDRATVEVDEAIEANAFPVITSATVVGDLSDGGRVGDATVMPTRKGVVQAKGRATVMGGWRWDGTPTTMTLAWNPEGTSHDYARHYLIKRHCFCCHFGGFTGSRCPMCVKNHCSKCIGSDDTETIQTFQNGDTLKGWIGAQNYTVKERVPMPVRFYGDIPCFLPLCPRTGTQGFQTQQDMRMHARMRHRLEYQSHTDALQESKTDETIELRKRVDELMLHVATQGQKPVQVAEAEIEVVKATEQLPSETRPLYESDRDRVERERREQT